MKNWQEQPYRIAIDCSTNMIGIAVFNDESIVTGDRVSTAKLRSGDRPGHSKLLVTIMNDCMDEFTGGNTGIAAMQEFKPEAILLSNGPGSFTGLRIAVATAKTLGIGLKVPVTTFSSLHFYNYCIAKAAGIATEEVVVLLDAKQKRCYAGFFGESGEWQEIDVNPAELVARLPEHLFAYNELELTEKYIAFYDETNGTNVLEELWPGTRRLDFFGEEMAVNAGRFQGYFTDVLRGRLASGTGDDAVNRLNLSVAANYLRKPQANLPKAKETGQTTQT